LCTVSATEAGIWPVSLTCRGGFTYCICDSVSVVTQWHRLTIFRWTMSAVRTHSHSFYHGVHSAPSVIVITPLIGWQSRWVLELRWPCC